MPAPQNSSFFKREISKQDAIIQLFRPVLGNQISQALDLFERTVARAELLTTLGTEFGAGEAKFLITPKDLQDNLDEYPELQKLAVEGRALLNSIGYKPRRRSVPITGAGTAPVGKTVDVQAITMTDPGNETLSGAVITPKKK